MNMRSNKAQNVPCSEQNRRSRKNRYLATLFVCFLLLLFTPQPTVASQSDTGPRVIRVGWFDYAGFYMMDEQGHRSGYAYDYLQEIARHAGWRYEYMEGTVVECLERLESGEIDIMGAVMYSPERTNTLDFSAMPLGKNYSILTTQADNDSYQLGQTNNFNGILIGALKGDIRQQELVDYAEEQGFTYLLTEYDTPALMEEALQSGQIGAILTTNMRVARGRERMIAQFAPVEFYIVTAKDNSLVMSAVNTAMEQIEFSKKGFQSDLSQKYFSVDLSSSLAFTEKEKEYIEKHPVIQIAISTQRPTAYMENGKLSGILVDIMDEVAARIGITFEYLPVATQTKGINALASGKIQMLANVYNDYGWAEMNQLNLSRPYMMFDYMSVTRVNSDLNMDSIEVAAVEGFRFSYDYVGRHFSSEQITWYPNELECIDAVLNGRQDICFVNSYTANEYLPNYKYRGLQSSIISYSHGLSVGVRADDSEALLSLVDKAIASIGATVINNIIDNDTMYKIREFSFGDWVLRFPIQFICFFGAFTSVIIAFLSLLCFTWYKRKKNEELNRLRRTAEHDSLTGLYNRVAYEVLVTQLLQKRHSPDAGTFVMIDIDDFKQINDRNGHSHGDQVLVSFAKKLDELFAGHYAILSRMGGDEFSLFLPDLPASEQAFSLIHSAREQLAQETETHIPVQCSAGIAFVSEQLCDFSLLYNAADKALYEAKRSGKSTVLPEA